METVTSLAIFEALRQKAANLPPGSVFEINEFDAEDLMRLAPVDFASCGFDSTTAERLAGDLAAGNLAELNAVVGVQLHIRDWVGYIIPGTGLRRTAGSLANDGQTMEEMFEELDRIRHPERYPT